MSDKILYYQRKSDGKRYRFIKFDPDNVKEFLDFVKPKSYSYETTKSKSYSIKNGFSELWSGKEGFEFCFAVNVKVNDENKNLCWRINNKNNIVLIAMDGLKTNDDIIVLDFDFDKPAFEEKFETVYEEDNIKQTDQMEIIENSEVDENCNCVDTDEEKTVSDYKCELECENCDRNCNVKPVDVKELSERIKKRIIDEDNTDEDNTEFDNLPDAFEIKSEHISNMLVKNKRTIKRLIKEIRDTKTMELDLVILEIRIIKHLLNNFKQPSLETELKKPFIEVVDNLGKFLESYQNLVEKTHELRDDK